MSEEESIPKDIISSQETDTHFGRNIEEDTRFQAFLGEQNDLDAKLNVLGLFKEKHPDDYETYERDSIWYNDEDQPDVLLDLFYMQLDRVAHDEGTKRLIEVGSEFSDPNQALTAMAESYETSHFEPRREKFSGYKTKFPGKVNKYRESAAKYNKNWLDMDLYAEERLADVANKPSAVGLAFHKAVIKQRLGERAPNVPIQDLSAELWRAIARDIRGRSDDDVDDKLRRKVKEIWNWFFSEQPEEFSSETDTSPDKT